jgi:hypothetical protein
MTLVGGGGGTVLRPRAVEWCGGSAGEAVVRRLAGGGGEAGAPRTLRNQSRHIYLSVG